MASQLWQLGLDLTRAVSDGPMRKFKSFLKVYRSLPNLERILAGQAKEKGVPGNPGSRFAICKGLPCRVGSVEQALRAMDWRVRKTTAEWVQLFETVSQVLVQEERFRSFIGQYRRLLGAANY